jgi:hypothetical protein
MLYEEPPVERVIQLDEEGCGPACVAMIAGISYEEACRSVYAGRTPRGTSNTDLRKALATYGIKLGPRISLEGKRLRELQKNGIMRVSVEDVSTHKRWPHWIVWDAKAQAMLDPTDQLIMKRRTRPMAIFEVM